MYKKYPHTVFPSAESFYTYVNYTVHCMRMNDKNMRRGCEAGENTIVMWGSQQGRPKVQ